MTKNRRWRRFTRRLDLLERSRPKRKPKETETVNAAKKRVLANTTFPSGTSTHDRIS